MFKLKWAKPLYILKLQERFSLPEDFFMLILSACVGVIGGFTLVLYHHVLDDVNYFFFQLFPSWFPLALRDYVPIIVPALGGLLIGSIFLFVKRYEKEYGAPAIMDAVVNNGGYMPKRLTVITFIASIVCIASGGSVGKEGPSILIGAGIASFIGYKLNLSSDRLRLLVGAGAATGLAAAFNVPIAAAIFAFEIIMADFSMRAFSPVIIASVFSTTISRMYISDAPVFEITAYKLNSPLELPLYMILGLIGGYLGVLFIRSFRYTHNVFKSIQLPDLVKTIIGFLIVGVLGFFFNEVYGFDDQVINNIIGGNYTIGIAFILILIKMLATNISLGCGGIGGLFTPTLIIGGLYGFSFGLGVNYLFPEITAPPGAYAVVGMAVLSTGVQHAMLSSIMMIFECTSDYHIMLPLMVSVVPAILISRNINKNSIYTMQFEFWGDRIARGRNVEILEKMSVEPIINTTDISIHEHTPLLGIINKFMETNVVSFPVIRDDRTIVGIISLQDIRSIMFEDHVHSLLIASDVAKNSIVVIHDNENFEQAFNKFDVGDYDTIPVVYAGTKTLRGIISRDDLMKTYRKELLFNGT